MVGFEFDGQLQAECSPSTDCLWLPATTRLRTVEARNKQRGSRFAQNARLALVGGSNSWHPLCHRALDSFLVQR
jgi:hypothetical protein